MPFVLSTGASRHTDIHRINRFFGNRSREGTPEIWETCDIIVVLASQSSITPWVVNGNEHWRLECHGREMILNDLPCFPSAASTEASQPPGRQPPGRHSSPDQE